MEDVARLRCSVGVHKSPRVMPPRPRMNRWTNSRRPRPGRCRHTGETRRLGDLRELERLSLGYRTFSRAELPKFTKDLRALAEQLLRLEMSTLGRALPGNRVMLGHVTNYIDTLDGVQKKLKTSTRFWIKSRERQLTAWVEQQDSEAGTSRKGGPASRTCHRNRRSRPRTTNRCGATGCHITDETETGPQTHFQIEAESRASPKEWLDRGPTARKAETSR